jgi:uncharacterized protein
VRAVYRDKVTADDTGGDAACWANLVCEDCGAVRGDPHRPGCAHAYDGSRAGDSTRRPRAEPPNATVRPD